MSREKHLKTLFELFRTQGYEGVSLSNISTATGLGRASLYHHFPGGKAEMVTATLAYSNRWIEESILPILQSEEPPLVRFQQMCDRLSDLYASGHKPCLLAALTAGTSQAAFQDSIQANMRMLTEAIASVLTAADVDPTTSQQRGEDALVSIQGALIVAKGLKDTRVFQRAIARIPEDLCQDLPATDP
ncbi:MAG: TetR/AcrR family transcriptional regulator [Cyanobacteria bacterium J06649_5]